MFSLVYAMKALHIFINLPEFLIWLKLIILFDIWIIVLILVILRQHCVRYVLLIPCLRAQLLTHRHLRAEQFRKYNRFTL